jgi:hypothetical protein
MIRQGNANCLIDRLTISGRDLDTGDQAAGVRPHYSQK